MKRPAAALLLLTLAGVAQASDQRSFLDDLVRDVRARIDAAILARPPKLVPPKKLDVRYRLVKLGALELGAPLAALTGGDLDGDGKAELYAVTAREVIAIGLRGKKLEELGRIPFAGDLALPASRDVVATAVVDGPSVVASASPWARGLRVTWDGKTLAALPGEMGFMLCPGEVAQLALGRNYFGDAATGYYNVRCTSALVEPDGHPIRARAQLSLAGKLAIAIERCAAQNLGCAAAASYEYGSVGVAFEIADVDRDGRPELIFSAASAPGDPDVLKIVTLGEDDKKQRKLEKRLPGGVAGLAFADLDGNGAPEVVAAVRLAGASRVELWRVQ